MVQPDPVDPADVTQWDEDEDPESHIGEPVDYDLGEDE